MAYKATAHLRTEWSPDSCKSKEERVARDEGRRVEVEWGCDGFCGGELKGKEGRRGMWKKIGCDGISRHAAPHPSFVRRTGATIRTKCSARRALFIGRGLGA
jgi:hypothetical protein